MSVSVEDPLVPVRAAVESRGLNTVARDLRMPRLTLASALRGRARPGTLALIAERWRALKPAEVRP